MKHADNDLEHLLTTTVPPAALAKVNIFEGPLQKWTEEALFGDHCGMIHCKIK